MSRVIAIVACGLSVAACSASMPSLDFLKSSPQTEALAIEIRAAGRRGEGLDGTELPYALSTHGPAGRGTVGDAGAQRISAADRVGARGRGHLEACAESRSLSSCSRAPRRRRANRLRRRSRPRRPCASRRRQRPHRPCRLRRPHPPRLRRRRHQPLRRRLRRPPSRQRPRPTILGRRDSDGCRLVATGDDDRRRPAHGGALGCTGRCPSESPYKKRRRRPPPLLFVVPRADPYDARPRDEGLQAVSDP